MVCLLSGLEPLEKSVDDRAGTQQVRDFSERRGVLAGVRRGVRSRIRPADGNKAPGTVGEEQEQVQRALPPPVFHHGQDLSAERMSLAGDDDRLGNIFEVVSVWGIPLARVSNAPGCAGRSTVPTPSPPCAAASSADSTRTSGPTAPIAPNAHRRGVRQSTPPESVRPKSVEDELEAFEGPSHPVDADRSE